MFYKCDRCKKIHNINEQKILDQQIYVAPYGCYEGDYYVHENYFFTCNCGRNIETDKQHINQNNIEKCYKLFKGIALLEEQNFIENQQLKLQL